MITSPRRINGDTPIDHRATQPTISRRPPDQASSSRPRECLPSNLACVVAAVCNNRIPEVPFRSWRCELQQPAFSQVKGHFCCYDTLPETIRAVDPGLDDDGADRGIVFIFVGARKVFYQSNGKAADPKRIDFAFDADIQPGVNVITVVARENEDTVERRTMIVRRDGPNGEALPTPKAETLGEDWDLGAGGD